MTMEVTDMCEILHQAKSWQLARTRCGILREMLIIPSP